MAKLVLNFPVSTADKDTLERLGKVRASPEEINQPSHRVLLFLRQVEGRASIALASFYTDLALSIASEDQRQAWSYAEKVKFQALQYSARWTTALCVRAIYDHAKGTLTARAVRDASPDVEDRVTKFWAERNSREEKQARAAFKFLREHFARSAIPISSAPNSECVLARRVALLKAYADREGAHISVQHYEFTTVDLAHVVTATALVGAVIHHFDFPVSAMPEAPTGGAFIARLDEGAHQAAMSLCPWATKLPRMFEKADLEAMVPNLYRENRLISGAEYLSSYLPSALGLDAPPRKFFELMNPAT